MARATDVVVVIGTRPEAIKLAPVVRELRRRGAGAAVVSTGQHGHLLDQVFDDLGITPDVELQTMRPGQPLADLTAVLVERLGGCLRDLGARYVLVQGDTTTAMSGALSAFYERIPIGHVEAGLRSRDLGSPYPEEANRRIVAVIATDHFCPTARARDALLAEGVRADGLRVTGNTVIDTLLWAVGSGRATVMPPMRGRPRRILLTLHRRENQGAPMRALCHAVRSIVAEREVEVVLPLHPSPAVRDVVVPLLLGVDGVTLREPLDYFAMAGALQSCDLVLTDSGGLQEEAPALGKPVLVLRSTTERPEGIDAGVSRLVGTDPAIVVEETLRLLDDPAAYAAMARIVHPFGDGRASERVAAHVVDRLEERVVAAA